VTLRLWKKAWVALAVAGIVLTWSAPAPSWGFLKRMAAGRGGAPVLQKRTLTAKPLRSDVTNGANDRRAGAAPGAPGGR